MDVFTVYLNKFEYVVNVAKSFPTLCVNPFISPPE